MRLNFERKPQAVAEEKVKARRDAILSRVKGIGALGARRLSGDEGKNEKCGEPQT
jgi:hypothetical protein